MTISEIHETPVDATIDGATAETTAEWLRRAVEELQAVPDGAGPIRLTVSVGVAALEGRTATPEQLLHAADGALYQAKRTGRNRTVRAEGVAPT